MIEYLQHHRIQLALHSLKKGQGLVLLLLHGLGERSPSSLPAEYTSWPGPVYALDFTGHGYSTVPVGGGYSCETLMADVDVALTRIGPATVVGRGIGAYVALLIAGARPQRVRGAILLDGPGLAGGGSTSNPYIPVVDTAQLAPPDPFAIAELATDGRPPTYATHFAMLAEKLSDLACPLSVCTCEIPDWLSAVMDAISANKTTLEHALRKYASQSPA